MRDVLRILGCVGLRFRDAELYDFEKSSHLWHETVVLCLPHACGIHVSGTCSRCLAVCYLLFPRSSSLGTWT